MNILLILAIFWPALAGLVIFLTPGCKENKQLRLEKEILKKVSAFFASEMR